MSEGKEAAERERNERRIGVWKERKRRKEEESGRRREEELIGGSSLLAGGARPTSASQQALPTSHSIRPPKQNGHQVSRLEEGQLNGISITEAKWPPSVSRADN